MRHDLAAGIAAASAFVCGLLYGSCDHGGHASIAFRKTEVDPPPHIDFDDQDVDAGVAATHVEIGTPLVQGDYAVGDVSDLVETHERDLLACGRHAHLTGTVTVYFAIRSSGETAYADADATDLDAAQCLAEVFDHMTFPHPDDGDVVTASVPLTFSP